MPADLPRRGAPLLLGLDLGTGRCKAALAARDGRVLHVARRATPTRRLPDGGAEHPAGDLLAAVESLLAECARAAEGLGRRIGAIGVASMSEAGVPVGEERPAASAGMVAAAVTTGAGALAVPDAVPLGDVLAWFDPRPAAEAAEIGASLGPARLHAITGLRPDAKYTLPKLLWLSRHRPDLLRRMTAWAGVAELAALHLSGALATNASLACRTLAFDVAARAWRDDLLEMAGLDAGHMPPVLPFARPAGGLRPGIAARLGLQAGVPVVVAGHDHVVGGLAVGVAGAGQVLDSIGTAETALLVTDEPRLDDSLRAAGLSTGCHAVDARWYVLGGLQASGAVVDWFVDSFLGGDSGDRYAAFVRLVDAAPPGPSGVLVLPYLRGRSAPRPDLHATLDVLGLGPDHGLPDLALGVLDGTAFAVRWIVEELERAAGAHVGVVRVTGGGTRNRRWVQIRAALDPWPLEVARAEESVALGAAIVGGIGAGIVGEIGAGIVGETGAGFTGPCGEPAVEPTAVERVPADPELRDAYEAAYRGRFLPAALRGMPGDEP